MSQRTLRRMWPAIVLTLVALAAPAVPQAAPVGVTLTRGDYNQTTYWDGGSTFNFGAGFTGIVVFAGRPYGWSFSMSSPGWEGTYDGVTSSVTAPIRGTTLKLLTGECTTSWTGKPLPPFPKTLLFHCFGSVLEGPVGGRDILVTLTAPESRCHNSCNGVENHAGTYRAVA